VWTWVAIDAETKLVPSWAVARRDGFTAATFIRDLADRLSTRVQLTTDGHKVYLEAIEGAFGFEIDYARLRIHKTLRSRRRWRRGSPITSGRWTKSPGLQPEGRTT